MHGSGVLDMAAQIEKQALFFFNQPQTSRGTYGRRIAPMATGQMVETLLTVGPRQDYTYIIFCLRKNNKKFHLDIATQIPSSFARRNPYAASDHTFAHSDFHSTQRAGLYWRVVCMTCLCACTRGSKIFRRDTTTSDGTGRVTQSICVRQMQLLYIVLGCTRISGELQLLYFPCGDHSCNMFNSSWLKGDIFRP